MVELSDGDIERLSGALGLSDADFRARYTRRLRRGGVRLVDKRNRDCIFYESEAGCSVHASRPDQCRSYPFWPSHLYSPESWVAEARCCPGIGEGRRWTRGELDALIEHAAEGL